MDHRHIPFRIIRYLKEKNCPVSFDDLFLHIWEQQYNSEKHSNQLYYNINRARKVLKPNEEIISTEYNHYQYVYTPTEERPDHEDLCKIINELDDKIKILKGKYGCV